MNRFRRESIKCLVVRRVNRNQLSLKMRGQFGQLDVIGLQGAADLVAISFAFSGALQIKEPAVPGRDLYAFVPERRSPA